MIISRAFIFVALIGSATMLLQGCASPASKEAVVVHSLNIAQHYQKTVAVTTQGGSETNALDRSDISNNDLKKAIEESIVENGLFTRVVHGSNSDYLLNVNIVNMSKPMFGGSFTVRMEAAWSLSDKATKKAIMRDSITSSYTATMGQALIGVTRLRLAIEGAVRKNIQQGLMRISELQLD